jgi:Ca2+-binding RTX toxin-like protein
LYAPKPYVNMHRSTLEWGLALTRSSRKEKTKEGEKMRRVTMLLAALAVMVTLFTAVAYAGTIEGTSQSDNLNESQLADDIFGRGGNDIIDADFYTTPEDEDELRGNRGNDEIDASDGDDSDFVNGGPGTDECAADDGDEVVNCELPIT